MKTTITILMLFVMGIILCPAGQVFAEDAPDGEVPELFDGTAQVAVFDTGAVWIDEAPEPDPEPEPSE